MARKSLYTRKLGGIVAQDIHPVVAHRYHVISGITQNWMVVSEGRIRPIKAFSTQRAAVDFAKRTASKITGEVIVHGKTGQIKDTISFT
jgi:hypothetical protein